MEKSQNILKHALSMHYLALAEQGKGFDSYHVFSDARITLYVFNKHANTTASSQSELATLPLTTAEISRLAGRASIVHHTPI